jgi:hypothetical protein
MAVDVANEPLKMFADSLAAVPALVTACGTRIRQSYGESFDGFPCCTFIVLGDRAGNTDAEAWQTRDYTIQVDLWSSSDAELPSLALAIDEYLGPLCEAGQLSSTNWSAKILRRTKAWNLLPWPGKKDATGNRLFQFTSDWRFRVDRKQ